MPLVASEQVKETVAVALFQPAAFGDGVTAALIVGTVVSLVMTGLIVLDPAAFVPMMVSVCAPSLPRSKSLRVQVPPAIVAANPLTVRLAAVPADPERLAVRVLMNEPGAGVISEIAGGGPVITWMVAVAVLPAASVATADMVAGDALPLRLSVICQVPSAAIVAACPLTRSVTSVSSSATVPLTRTCAASETTESLAGDVIVTWGAISSTARVTCELPLIVTWLAKMPPLSVDDEMVDGAEGA